MQTQQYKTVNNMKKSDTTRGAQCSSNQNKEMEIYNLPDKEAQNNCLKETQWTTWKHKDKSIISGQYMNNIKKLKNKNHKRTQKF